MRPRRSSKRAKTKALVNWLDLPRDVLIQIFIEVGTIGLLHNAQRVCSSWRAIAQDPQLYRVIDMRHHQRYFTRESLETFVKMARLAIDRSLGQLVDFSIDYYCTNQTLYDLMKKAPRLKCLRIAKVNMVNKRCVAKVIQKLPLLEEVEFTLCSFCRFLWTPDDPIVTIGFSCQGLKSFGLNGPPEKYSPGHPLLNQGALAVARNLNPRLQSLSLLGNSMNNDGLEAILQRFTQLEYLDLRRCANLDLKGDLLKKCVGIKTLRLPNDSTEDCPWLVGYESFEGAI